MELAHHSKTQTSPKDSTGQPCPDKRAIFRAEMNQASAIAAAGSDWPTLTQSQTPSPATLPYPAKLNKGSLPSLIPTWFSKPSCPQEALPILPALIVEMCLCARHRPECHILSGSSNVHSLWQMTVNMG